MVATINSKSKSKLLKIRNELKSRRIKATIQNKNKHQNQNQKNRRNIMNVPPPPPPRYSSAALHMRNTTIVPPVDTVFIKTMTREILEPLESPKREEIETITENQAGNQDSNQIVNKLELELELEPPPLESPESPITENANN